MKILNFTQKGTVELAGCFNITYNVHTRTYNIDKKYNNKRFQWSCNEEDGYR